MTGGSGIIPCQFLDFLEDPSRGGALEPAQHPEAKRPQGLSARSSWPVAHLDLSGLPWGALFLDVGLGVDLGLKHSKGAWRSVAEGCVAGEAASRSWVSLEGPLCCFVTCLSSPPSCDPAARLPLPVFSSRPGIALTPGADLLCSASGLPRPCLPVQCWNGGPLQAGSGNLSRPQELEPGPQRALEFRDVGWGVAQSLPPGLVLGPLRLPGGLSSLAGCGLLLPQSGVTSLPVTPICMKRVGSGWGENLPKPLSFILRVLV